MRSEFTFSTFVLAFFLGFVFAQNSTNGTYDVLDYVDQLIGSANGGMNTLNLQCMPF